MGIERAVRIRRVNQPAAAIFLCHDINHTAYRISGKTYRHNSLVNLYTFSKSYRYIIETE